MTTKTNHWRVDIVNKPDVTDAHGLGVLGDIRDLGIAHVQAVESSRVFLLDGALSRDQASHIATELLADPVCEACEVYARGEPISCAPAPPASRSTSRPA